MASKGGVLLIVAINKMDKPSADPDRVLNELTGQNKLYLKSGR